MKPIVRWLIISLVVLLILALTAIIVYVVFIRGNPYFDARKAAKLECGCQEQYNHNLAVIYRQYVDNFGAFNFKSKDAAQKSLQSRIIAEDQKLQNCLTETRKTTESLRLKYSANPKNVEKFDEVKNQTICNPAEESEKNNLNAELADKISSLSESEPSAEQIKSDLIGKFLGNTNWRFAAPEEFVSFIILNKTSTEVMLEYKLDMELSDFITKVGYHTLATARYNLSPSGEWVFSDIIASEFTYDDKTPCPEYFKQTGTKHPSKKKKQSRRK